MYGGMRHMAEPRLRTVNKAVAPFAVNKFPTSFVETLAQNIVYDGNKAEYVIRGK